MRCVRGTNEEASTKVRNTSVLASFQNQPFFIFIISSPKQKITKKNNVIGAQIAIYPP